MERCQRIDKLLAPINAVDLLSVVTDARRPPLVRALGSDPKRLGDRFKGAEQVVDALAVTWMVLASLSLAMVKPGHTVQGCSAGLCCVGPRMRTDAFSQSKREDIRSLADIIAMQGQSRTTGPRSRGSLIAGFLLIVLSPLQGLPNA